MIAFIFYLVSTAKWSRGPTIYPVDETIGPDRRQTDGQMVSDLLLLLTLTRMDIFFFEFQWLFTFAKNGISTQI